MSRRRTRGRRGKPKQQPVVGGLPAIMATEKRASTETKREFERAAKADPKFAREQVQFFHRVRALAQMEGTWGVETRVKQAWLEKYGTELTSRRFNYLAFDPDHESRRIACTQEVLREDPRALIAENPHIQHHAAMAFCGRAYEDVMAPGNRTITGSSTLRVRNKDTGEWEDIPVIHASIPEKAHANVLEFMGKLHATYAGFYTVAARVGMVPGQMQGQASQQTTNVNVLVPGGPIPKATSLVSTEDDDTGPKVPHEQALALMAQEGRPFYEPPGMVTEYTDHVKLMRMQDLAAGIAAKRTLEAERVDRPPSPEEEAKKAHQAEMLLGVELDDAAVIEADAADRELPDSRRLDR